MVKKITMRNGGNRGAAMTLAVLFFSLIAIVVVLGSASPVLRDLKNAQALIQSKNSYYTGEAGIEDAFYRIKKGKQLSNPEVLSLNEGTASVASANVSSTEKEIIATSDVSTRGRNIKLSIFTGIGSDFAYGAQVGEGGLDMGNNSAVKGIGGAQGNVYSNGPITGSNGAVVTGDATVATSLIEDTSARAMTCNADQNIGVSSPQIDFAQSFVAGGSLPLSRVSLYVKKVGSPSSPSIKIVDNVSGSPDDESVSSGTLLSGNVTGSYGWIDVSFATPANLIEGNTYWIVVDSGANASNYFVWCRDSNNGFGNGVAKYKSDWSKSGSWTQIAGDLNFRTYLGGGTGSIDNVGVNENARANTITNSTIGGTAYCQTGSNNNKSCDTSFPDASPMNMPFSDANLEEFKNTATAGGVIVGDCGNSGVAICTVPNESTISLGPKKIIGNLILSNKGTLNLTGTVYVDGYVSVSVGTKIKCDASYGSDSCALITSGMVDAANNALFEGSGQPGSFILIITDKEGCNGDGGGVGCTSNDSAISLGNNLEGAVFYASKSMIDIANNGIIKAVVGYKLKLAQNAQIQYEQGVTDANFSSGPGGGWNVKSWKEVE